MNVIKLLVGWAFYLFVLFVFSNTKGYDLKGFFLISIILLYVGSLLIYFNNSKLKNLNIYKLEKITSKTKRIVSIVLLLISVFGFISLFATDDYIEKEVASFFLILWVIGWRLFYRYKTALKLINNNIVDNLKVSRKQTSKATSTFQRLLLSVAVSIFVIVFAKTFIGINNAFILTIMFIFTLIILTLQVVPIGELNIKLNEGLFSLKRSEREK